ncbi:extra-large guanine nucleotide-binding protein 3-like [Silene latifolia]|uniref:extra-large guanine nucleotide-binding protein 3-like n=1 Tax=Silene latifolia TaxID=37657 RepID=UPI003D778BEC
MASAAHGDERETTTTSTTAASTSLQQLLRKMLPPGAPFLDEDHLDYSFAVDYDVASFSPPPPAVSSAAVTKPVTTNFRFKRNESFLHSTTSNGSSSYCTIEDSETTSNSNLNSNSLFSVDLRSDHSENRREEIRQNIDNLNENVDEKRLNGVTFRSDGEEVEEDEDEDESRCSSAHEEEEEEEEVVVSPIVSGEKRVWKKRGPCSRCNKGNRLSRREMCIVCDAKYCKNCVLKAMGSMPEGRKCVSCIGKAVDESKRVYLGKFSRILWKVCSDLEVKQIIKAEKECSANQLRPEQIVVNGRQLVMEELVELFGCSLPPRNLKPGRYWYDKDSGFWGKVGEKPDRIISSKLNVGGKLQADASNGNTKVFINGREITKVELRVLKLAKVQCPQDTHFWLYDDGSYEEEGQNNIKGNIWGKASTRALCSLLSLPVPHGKIDDSRNDPTTNSGGLVPDYIEQKKIYKLLLFGLEGSGTSTIFKQVKFVYGNMYTPEELQNIKLKIQSNLYKYLGVLLEGREKFEDEALDKEKDTEDGTATDPEFRPGNMSVDGRNHCIYSINPRLKKHADWLLQIMATGDMDAFFPAATREYSPLVEELWKDPAIQETYKRKEELNFLPDTTKYFLDRVIEISSNDYEPSEKDVLYAEGVTQSNGLASVEFLLDSRSPLSIAYSENHDHPPPLTKYQLIRIKSSGLQDGFKWLGMFEDVRAVIYCVALSDYDVLWENGIDSLSNKMLASRQMFESLLKHPSLRDIPFVLLLNKYDVFEEKISKVPLTTCDWFQDFCPVNPQGSNQSLAQQAYYYVAVKFKELYADIKGQKLYVWPTKALERSSVDEAFKFVHEVFKWDDVKEEHVYGLNGDESFYSTEVSS